MILLKVKLLRVNIRREILLSFAAYLFICLSIFFNWWYINQWVTSYELQVNILTSCIYCTCYELPFAHKLWVSVYCTSYESYFTCALQVIVYSMSYKLLLLHELRVIVYCTRYELRVTFGTQFMINSCLLHELRVIFYTRVTSYCLFRELQVTIIARVTSCCLLQELRVTSYLWHTIYD